jgi:hypothetical protein
VEDVEKHFGEFRGHAAIKLAQKLRSSRGVSFDACMSMAVHLKDAEKCAERIPLDPRPASLDSRWRPPEVQAFLPEVRAFIEESRFQRFYAEHKPLYQTAKERVQALLDKNGHLEWFGEFFGEGPPSQFTVAIALLNGPANYGPHCRLPDGQEDLYCILGAWLVDSEGQPTFSVGVVETVVHEFCHSHVNSIVDRHEKEFQPAGQKLFERVAKAMRRQAYGNWKTMIYESLVRACTIRHVRRYQGAMAARWKILDDQGRQFQWVGRLADLLEDYEKNRPRYPNLEAFSPRLVAFFQEEAAKEPNKTEAKAPRVVSVNPTDGAVDVDPALGQIRVVFDRPMRDNSWALVGSKTDLPETTGKPSYDSKRTTWTVPIRLKPESSYRFMLNSERFQGFRSADGVPLEPVTVRFKTGKSRSK